MVDRMQSLMLDIAADPAGLARIAIVALLVFVALRLLARIAWGAARMLALILTVAILLSLLFGRPTRLHDFSTLREEAAEAARDLIH